MHRTRTLDYLEILPPSSLALKEEVKTILENSRTLSAAIMSLNKESGSYKIVLQGSLDQHLQSHQNAA